MTDKLVFSRRTPIDANYPSCESTFVELLVYLEEGDVAFVTDLLGLEPSNYQNKGDSIENSRGFYRVARSSYWCISSEGKVSSKDLRHHLKWLLDSLKTKELALARLQKSFGVTITVNCNWWSSSGFGGPTLWPEQMELLAKLNLECTFDIYFSDE
jgi:hypothetical protein